MPKMQEQFFGDVQGVQKRRSVVLATAVIGGLSRSLSQIKSIVSADDDLIAEADSNRCVSAQLR
ncbi:hypothetical protein ATY27_16725 [Rheinheimera sp. F8]|nr:hypothetical protein ATY27_16725 [Rheinheimera sp. F8]